MIDKYQVYMLYKTVKKMWTAKRFNTIVFRSFFEDTLENYLINQFINDNYRVEYMSNYGIKLVNEINCGIVTIEEWLMYVFEKCLKDKAISELKDINSVEKLKDSWIFKKRSFIKGQIDYVLSLERHNDGMSEFFDTKFSLYDLDDKQENQAYKLYREGKLDPEFYIQGMLNNKFAVDKDKIKDVDYKRFITFCEMILKLKKEISEKSKT